MCHIPVWNFILYAGHLIGHEISIKINPAGDNTKVLNSTTAKLYFHNPQKKQFLLNIRSQAKITNHTKKIKLSKRLQYNQEDDSNLKSGCNRIQTCNLKILVFLALWKILLSSLFSHFHSFHSLSSFLLEELLAEWWKTDFFYASSLFSHYPSPGTLPVNNATTP